MIKKWIKKYIDWLDKNEGSTIENYRAGGIKIFPLLFVIVLIFLVLVFILIKINHWLDPGIVDTY